MRIKSKRMLRSRQNAEMMRRLNSSMLPLSFKVEEIATEFNKQTEEGDTLLNVPILPFSSMGSDGPALAVHDQAEESPKSTRKMARSVSSPSGRLPSNVKNLNDSVTSIGDRERTRSKRKNDYREDYFISNFGIPMNDWFD